MTFSPVDKVSGPRRDRCLRQRWLPLRRHEPSRLVLLLPSGIHAWDWPRPNSSTRPVRSVFAENRRRFCCSEQVERRCSRPWQCAAPSADEYRPRTDGYGRGVRTYNVLLAERRPVAAALIAVDN